eukprot:TRINITY_DN13298_c0_g1_i4.p2 TRINITY_DN13298_c0_g1~~TRINITY_DN13298_c0_g1_i4.p2  ORF type:complete len:196 (+),score=18.39 TRINITY_DN13298_c0_g1_i4:418-1005(+)
MLFAASELPSACSAIGSIVLWHALFDAWFYWGHRLLHHPKLYWIHKKHHSFHATIGVAALFSHPIEGLLVNAGSTFVGPLLFPAHFAVCASDSTRRSMLTVGTIGPGPPGGGAHSMEAAGATTSITPTTLVTTVASGSGIGSAGQTRRIGCFVAKIKDLRVGRQRRCLPWEHAGRQVQCLDNAPCLRPVLMDPLD